MATFNVLHARSPADGRVDLGRYRAALASLDADLLALQEADRFQERSGRADLAAVAAEATGAVEHRFVAALYGTPGAAWTAATGRDRPDAAAYGVALVSRFPVREWRVVRLPVLLPDEPRVAVAALVEAPAGPLTVVATHLSFLPGWNARQLRALVRAVADLPRPLLLAGDLNLGPAAAARLTGMRPLVTAPTFPAGRPRRQLDHVLADGEARIAAAGARRLPVSDHRALVVDLS